MNEPVEQELSPDGRTQVAWTINTGRMSHEIRTPRITDAATASPILELPDTGYDGELRWEEHGFCIHLRHYWQPGELTLRVDRAAGTFGLPGSADPELRPLETLTAFVAAHFARASEDARTGEETPREEEAERERRSGWLILGLLVLVGLALAAWQLAYGF